jgi:hypothetical protein
MPIDGGIVVSYLTAYLLKGGKRLADRTFESLLDRLVQRVRERLGPRPVDTLKERPGDPANEALVQDEIDDVMRADRSFAAEVTRLIESLERRGGQQFVNQVYAQNNVQVIGRGLAAGGDIVYAPPPPDPSDISDAPFWVKLFLVVGAALCLTAFALFGYTLFTHDPELGDPDFGDPPPGIARAAVVFFVGFIVLAAAAIGRSMSKRPTRAPW